MNRLEVLWRGLGAGLIRNNRVVEGLALGTADSLASPTRLLSFFILGIFVRTAESNPFFTLP
jgi:hypothetical protein